MDSREFGFQENGETCQEQVVNGKWFKDLLLWLVFLKHLCCCYSAPPIIEVKVPQDSMCALFLFVESLLGLALFAW